MTLEFGRRNFIVRAFAFCLALLAGRRASAAPEVTGAGPGVKLLRTLRDPVSAAAVGLRCAHQFPGATVDSHLESLDLDVPGLVAALDANRVSHARRLIAASSRRDFDANNVVHVDGWVLSATEARLYALAALLKPGA